MIKWRPGTPVFQHADVFIDGEKSDFSLEVLVFPDDPGNWHAWMLWSCGVIRSDKKYKKRKDAKRAAEQLVVAWFAKAASELAQWHSKILGDSEPPG